MGRALLLSLSLAAFCPARAVEEAEAPLFPGATQAAVASAPETPSTAEARPEPAPPPVAEIVPSLSSAAASAPPPLAAPPGWTPTRAVHLTSWAAGAPRTRREFIGRARAAGLNAVVIPLKETDGRVYIPGVAKAIEYGTVRIAIPDPEALLRDLRAAGLRPIARIVVFKDDTLPRRRPQWAVRRPEGRLWLNDKGIAWVDPYRREVWDYNIAIALRAAALGFDEVQFDYIRFPSDGPTRQCRYSRADHSARTAKDNLREFLRYAHRRLSPMKVKLSVAVFGMTTTAKDDMGIGQEIGSMASLMDAVSPMMYPSHYYRGEYGLKDPNRQPFKVIDMGLRDAKARLGADAYKLRPYLQDFSLGYRYGQAEVRAQVLAARKQGIESWIFWNPVNRYQWGAFQ